MNTRAPCPAASCAPAATARTSRSTHVACARDADSAAELRLRAAHASTPTGRCTPGLPTKILQHPCDWPLAHQRRSAGRSHIPRGEEGFTPSRYHAVEAEARLNVSKCQDEKAERNRRARTRLTKALPHIFLRLAERIDANTETSPGAIGSRVPPVDHGRARHRVGRACATTRRSPCHCVACGSRLGGPKTARRCVGLGLRGPRRPQVQTANRSHIRPTGPSRSHR